ncbi:NACHT, LRR and PYD domains-containing protein 12-like, partial [Notechis scutatus]|uniref:NACHT, LRR and PYD domains-containing protein 12-like n=1 Tax=Notechis scutatus TaxID=8663 RepID=A0A6J1W019_9SAUR
MVLHNRSPRCRVTTAFIAARKVIELQTATHHRHLPNPHNDGVKVQISGAILTESCSRHLSEVLRKNHRLNVLHLFLKNPDDRAMEVLCEGLNHPECAIETLQLSGEILTESSSRHLAEVLRKKQRLNRLVLSLNNPDDKAMEVLCEGLKHPECAIKMLESLQCSGLNGVDLPGWHIEHSSGSAFE